MSDQPPSLYTWLEVTKPSSASPRASTSTPAADAILGPIFRDMDGHHPRFVAQFIGEVFGGPTDYSSQRGGHPHMIRAHLNRQLT